jgi:hypothetical protein
VVSAAPPYGDSKDRLCNYCIVALKIANTTLPLLYRRRQEITYRFTALVSLLSPLYSAAACCCSRRDFVHAASAGQPRQSANLTATQTPANGVDFVAGPERNIQLLDKTFLWFVSRILSFLRAILSACASSRHLPGLHRGRRSDLGSDTLPPPCPHRSSVPLKRYSSLPVDVSYK